MESQNNADLLVDIGFKDIAHWNLTTGTSSIYYQLDGDSLLVDDVLLDEVNSLYAFVCEESVMYIGKTSRTIRRRFVTYCRPGQRQATNLRCNRKIRDVIAAGGSVRILVFNPISFLKYGDFEINLAAGLEDSLIAEFDPPWNGRERGVAITEEAEREEIDESLPSADMTRTETERDVSGIFSFPLRLGETYYTRGLINTGVDASVYLGDHNEPIKVVFDDGAETVVSRINRTANRSGGVRVVGRNPTIARWFQRNFVEGDTVSCEVIDRNSILLHRSLHS